MPLSPYYQLNAVTNSKANMQSFSTYCDISHEEKVDMKFLASTCPSAVTQLSKDI
jgi:hypothetical protein